MTDLVLAGRDTISTKIYQPGLVSQGLFSRESQYEGQFL